MMDLNELNAQALNLKQTSFIGACREFFGLKPGQVLKDFADEVKQLTPQDKIDLIAMFRTVGFDATKVS
jgi:hypothetical protein